MIDTTWKRELTIAAVALGFGLFILPVLIYFVGQRLIGEYGEAGLLGLYEHIWTDFLSLRATGWILVLGAYVIVQLIRCVRRVWRPKQL
jgi:hypothetical protein